MNGDSGALSGEFMEKERVHTRCLQQRLEQLVTVHRQLLRKFTSLELENGELKKKISLRNERIKQLEVNARKMTSKLRIQIERHVSELTNLQESVTVCCFFKYVFPSSSNIQIVISISLFTSFYQYILLLS